MVAVWSVKGFKCYYDQQINSSFLFEFQNYVYQTLRGPSATPWFKTEDTFLLTGIFLFNDPPLQTLKSGESWIEEKMT